MKHKDLLELDRSTYKKIKAMNRTELSAFLQDITSELLNNRDEYVSKQLDIDVLEAKLSAIKGIGGVRLQEVMTVIRDFFGIE